MKSFTIVSRLFILVVLCSCSQALEQQEQVCRSFSCNPSRRETIQFPFRVPGNQSERCGYPGFEVECGPEGHTLLNLNNASTPLTVRNIDYADQVIWLSDPNSCMPNHVLNLNLKSTPYSYGPDNGFYSFLNCSGTNITTLDTDMLPFGTSVIACLSGGDYTFVTTFVKAAEVKMVEEMKCEVVKRVNTALWWPGMDEGLYPADMSQVMLELSWGVPGCGGCLLRGGSCAFVSDDGLDVGCFIPPNSGLSRGAKYGLALGIGLPALLCIIGLTYFISRSRTRTRTRSQTPRYVNNENLPSIFPQPMIITLGLDRPTIESYPKTILGESKRLPKTSDSTCPICLSEYQPKEILRSIPECNHYFHADCIDQWLRLNATCPLCRKSPQQQSAAARS